MTILNQSPSAVRNITETPARGLEGSQEVSAGAHISGPYYDHAGITIYHGDCREILPALPKVDLVLTDPPYGIGIATNPVRQKHERMEWDAAPPDAPVFALLARKARYQIIWGGNYFGLPASQCFLIWDKAQPENFSLAMCEQAWTNIGKPAKLFRMSVTSYDKEHPAQKPVALMAWCIRQLPEQPDTVLDPFLGSGTTLVACKRLGRRGIGIEIEEKYCEIAARRVEAERLTLFEWAGIEQETFDFTLQEIP